MEKDMTFALLGGTRRSAPQGSNLSHYSLIGGMNIDLSSATLPSELTVTKISFVGGVKLKVPANVRVEVSGFNLFGGRYQENRDLPADAPVVKVRAYGVWGGVNVQIV